MCIKRSAEMKWNLTGSVLFFALSLILMLCNASSHFLFLWGFFKDILFYTEQHQICFSLFFTCYTEGLLHIYSNVLCMLSVKELWVLI